MNPENIILEKLYVANYFIMIFIKSPTLTFRTSSKTMKKEKNSLKPNSKVTNFLNMDTVRKSI